MEWGEGKFKYIMSYIVGLLDGNVASSLSVDLLWVFYAAVEPVTLSQMLYCC